MTVLNELFRCNICSNVVEVVHEGADSLVCCGDDMEKLKVNEANPNNLHFAHIETVEKNESFEIKRISFNHIMNNEHYIEFIEAISKDGNYLKRKFLKPDMPCEMTLKCNCSEGFYVRLYCNRDGVWITK